MFNRTPVVDNVFPLQHLGLVREPGVQHSFLLQVREADHESIYPVPSEVCCERALQTMHALIRGTRLEAERLMIRIV